MKFAIHPLVNRQTVESNYSHFDGDTDILLEILEAHFDKAVPIPEVKGAVKVEVPITGFWSPIIPIEQAENLGLSHAARLPDEDPFLQPKGTGKKVPAKSVRFIVYSHAALGKDASSNAAWELISFNADPTEEEAPMDPYTMARNQLGLKGGTKTTYTPEQWANSVRYWNTFIKVSPPPK